MTQAIRSHFGTSLVGFLVRPLVIFSAFLARWLLKFMMTMHYRLEAISSRRKSRPVVAMKRNVMVLPEPNPKAKRTPRCRRRLSSVPVKKVKVVAEEKVEAEGVLVQS